MLKRMIAVAAAAAGVSQYSAAQEFRLSVLQNNDGESKLLPIIRDADPGAGVNNQTYAGADRFVSVVQRERASAAASGLGSIVVASGDNIIPGPQFRASLANGTYYDARLFDRVGYNALSLGNHDFDFGPDVLADVIGATTGSYPFLAANLDFSAEPRLQALVGQGRIAPSTVVTVNGERVGIVGAVTPDLPRISSPRNVRVNPVLPAVQAEVDKLNAAGVNKVVLLTQLQNINNDLTLAGQLRGVDVIVSGGGQETVANPATPLLPGDVANLPYPRLATSAAGEQVAVFTTNGEYRYLGRLDVTFDAGGRVTGLAGAPNRVTGNPSDPDAVAPDAFTTQNVVEPVRQYVSSLANNVIARSEVPLQGTRDVVRTRETNLGNLVADALLDRAQELAPAFGADVPRVAFQNSGGIRNNSLLFSSASTGAPANFSELNTDEVLPFANFLTVVKDVPAQAILSLLENAVSQVPAADGRFAQVAGFEYTYDPSRPTGDRVLDVILDDGTVLVEGGAVVAGAPTLDVATIDFLARGGDFYPFENLQFTNLGTTYQQALFDYLTTDLGGLVRAADYPAGGEGRITAVPEPAAPLALVGAAAAIFVRRRAPGTRAGRV